MTLVTKLMGVEGGMGGLSPIGYLGGHHPPALKIPPGVRGG